MAFRAVHRDWGTVFAHLPDLGCGQSWEAIWKRRPSRVVCDECQHPMHAKHSQAGLRFFAHAANAPACQIARDGESVAHHLLKLELLTAARDAGAHAELEVRGPDGSWRADVLASDPAGAWRMALEAQLSPITAPDITARTARMDADGVASCWFSDRPRPPWLGTVPSIRLAARADVGLVVVEGLVKFTGQGWDAVTPHPTLRTFLEWVFARRILPHTLRTPAWDSRSSFVVGWTAPRYAAQEAEYFTPEMQAETAAKKAERILRESNRRRNEQLRLIAIGHATDAETLARHREGPHHGERAEAARKPWVLAGVAHLAHRHGLIVEVGWTVGDPRYADGIPLVGTDGVPVAVLNPSGPQVKPKAVPLLEGLRVLFMTNPQRRIFLRTAAHHPANGYRNIEVVGVPACTCETPDAVVMIGTDCYVAVPTEAPGPAAARFEAHCRTCEGVYDRPWRIGGFRPPGLKT